MVQIFKSIFQFVLVLVFYCSFAQQSAIYTSANNDFDKAKALFENGQFLLAKTIFETVKTTVINDKFIADCDFYLAYCEQYQNRYESISLFEAFIINNSTSLKKNEAILILGNLNFLNQDFQKASNWYEKVDDALILENTDAFYFNFGYSLFKLNKRNEAFGYFKKVADSDKFGNQSKYYLGYLAYQNDDFKEANKQFSQIGNDDNVNRKMAYYQADMNFKSGNFQKSIDTGIAAMLNANENEKSELNKIVGESYFNLNQFEKSIPYLELYKGKIGKWNNTDYYMLGYAFYKKGDFEKAIFYFSKIIDGKDFVAQNAYYHLGESYLKSNKKQQALSAFKSASEMDFEASIKEDAFFNYAKLSYELGNSFQSVPDILVALIDKYPNNPNKNEIETLLIDSFVSAKNYKSAWAILEKSKSGFNKLAYQKVLFFIGLERFNESMYNEALQQFKKSIAVSQDAKFVARAKFWQAETEFVLDNFEDAILSFKQFLSDSESPSTPEFKNINYNLGYSYFKIKDYPNAMIYLLKFVETKPTDPTRLTDSYVRLGDCNFVSSKYWAAIDFYNKAIELKSVHADYAAFQKAISFGFLSKNDRKIGDLNLFVKNYPKSQFLDDAFFELANTYVVQNDAEKALVTFDKLLDSFPNGSYISKSILKQGLIYFNSDKDDLALLKLKKVVADYPNSAESYEAIATAKLIYIESGKVADYTNWIKTVNFVQVSDLELENDTFEAAEKFYLQNDKKLAIDGFVGYISSFPNGVHALKANFYLAQLYFSDGLYNNAIQNYEYVISKPRSTFSEESLLKLSQIYLKENNKDKTILNLSRLETEADFPQNVTFAQANLMKLYYENSDFVNAIIAAEKVANNPKTDEKVRNDAQIIIARTAFKTDDFAKSKMVYAKLLSTATGELAAESLYYDSFFKNAEKQFEASNVTIQLLTKNYSSYKYFGAKALIVMAKNFYGLKDAFQANYILESIIANFGNFQDVIEEAKKELAIIKTEEAKTNESIQK